MRLTAGTTPTITGRLSVASARDAFTDAVARAEWLEHIRAGRAFGVTRKVTAAAGNLPHVGLRFAAGRVNRAVIFSAVVSSPTAQNVQWGWATAGLIPGTGRNRLRGGADGIATGCQLDQIANALALVLGEAIIPANTPVVLQELAGVELLGDAATLQSLLFVGLTVATTLVGSFAYAEVA